MSSQAEWNRIMRKINQARLEGFFQYNPYQLDEDRVVYRAMFGIEYDPRDVVLGYKFNTRQKDYRFTFLEGNNG